MSQDKIFPDGFIFKRAREGAPDFVKGAISIKCKDFVDFMRKHVKADGWMNLDLLMSKEGKLYTVLNDWKPQQKENNVRTAEDIVPTSDHSAPKEDDFDKIPF